MREYEYNNTIYIDINDIRNEHKSTYCRGIRSNTQLLEKKNIKDYVYGRIINDELTITEKLSKKLGSIFINKDAIGELFIQREEDNTPPAPPLIEDKDLVFFKDEVGREYYVPMRGERTKDGIFFQVKAIMYLFEMISLNNDMKHSNSGFKMDEHYTYFNMSKSGALQTNAAQEMYLTYAGLRRVIERCRSGIGNKFKNWIDEIVFSSLWGTKEQRVETFKKVLNVDADHLKAIMSKSPNAISCLYLVDIGVDDNNKKVFKYGLTCDVSRRFKEHIKHYGESIKLDTFILIPNLDLSKAETEFKNSISRYRYFRDSDNELISMCDEAYVNVKNIFRTISEKHCGNMRNQIAQYENQIKDLNHTHELQMNSLKMENLKLSMTIDLKDRDIEILQLKLQIAQKM